MKIIQSKVRVESRRATPFIPSSRRGSVLPKAGFNKPTSNRTSTVPKPLPMKKASTSAPSLRKSGNPGNTETSIALQRILESAQEELSLIRKMKEEAVKYQQQLTNKARSEAHQLILNARLRTQREMDEIVRQANEEIQKVLADIRVLRITAQEELATQRRLTDIATLNSLSLSIKDAFKKSAAKATKKKTAKSKA